MDVCGVLDARNVGRHGSVASCGPVAGPSFSQPLSPFVAGDTALTRQNGRLRAYTAVGWERALPRAALRVARPNVFAQASPRRGPERAHPLRGLHHLVGRPLRAQRREGKHWRCLRDTPRLPAPVSPALRPCRPLPPPILSPPPAGSARRRQRGRSPVRPLPARSHEVAGAAART